MDESPRWGSLQYFTLLLVMLAHTALLVWLMMAARGREGGTAASASVQLVLLPPRTLPRIRMDSVQPRRIEIRPLVSNPPPLLEGVSPATTAPAMNADVESMPACRQVSAMTVAWTHPLETGQPVRGSMM